MKTLFWTILATALAVPFIATGEWEQGRSLTVRAYCPCKECCGKWSDGFFANGEEAKGRAVASSTHPFGTILIVSGYGKAVVKDRGPNEVELFFENHADALEWGKKKCLVKIAGSVQE